MAIKDKRINERIVADEVRLVGNEGEQIGVVALNKALEMASEQALDLVEMSPNAKPIVCKIMDYGKYKYQEEKKIKDARKNQKQVHLKEVKFRPKIDKHDFDFKVRHALEFLKRGDKVKITIRFRGRELAHKDIGFEVINKVRAFLDEEIGIDEEAKARFEGRNIVMVVVASKKKRNK